MKFYKLLECLQLTESFLCEGFDIFPTSEADIDSYDFLKDEFKTNLKNLFKYLKTLEQDPDRPTPISLDKNIIKPKTKSLKIKLSTKFALINSLDIKELSEKFNLNIVTGEGSSGNRGGAEGKKFEQDIAKDIETYIQEGFSSPNFINPSLIKHIYLPILSKAKKPTDIKYELKGTKDTKRPLKKQGDKFLVDSGSNPGYKIADLVVTINNKEYYISAKKDNFSFFNLSLRQFLPPEDFMQGKIDKAGEEFLALFGIEPEQILKVFLGYKAPTASDYITDPKTGKKKLQRVKGKPEELNKNDNVTSKIDKNKLEDFLSSALAENYFTVQKISQKSTVPDHIKSYFVDKKFKDKALKIQDVTIVYPLKGQSKSISIVITTADYIFNINLRNTSGGVAPTTMVGYVVSDKDTNIEDIKD